MDYLQLETYIRKSTQAYVNKFGMELETAADVAKATSSAAAAPSGAPSGLTVLWTLLLSVGPLANKREKEKKKKKKKKK